MENKKRRWFPWPPKKGPDQEIQELINRIAEKPDDPRLHQRLAELYLEKGRKEQAIGEFIKAAECHSEAGFYLRAIALYRRILRMEEESSEILLRLAELYLANGLLGDALVQFRKVIQQYRKQGKTRDILGLLRRMVEVDPENLEVRGKYVELLRAEGFLIEAFDELIRFHLVQQERKRADLLDDLVVQIRSLYRELRSEFSQPGKERELASLEQKMGSVFQAVAPSPEGEAAPQEDQIDLDDEVVSEPEVPAELETPSELEILSESEMELRAEIELTDDLPEEGTTASGDPVSVQLQEALLYAEQGLFEEAEEIFRSILSADPDHAEAKRGLEQVREQHREIVQPQADSVYGKLNKLEEKHQARGAGTEQRESVETGATPPQNVRAHYEVALAYKDLGLLDECIVEFQAALQDPTLAFACYRELGACYRQKGDFEQAIVHFRKALQCPGVRKQQQLETGYELAQMLEQRGMRKQALILYRKIGETDRTFRDIQERVKSLSQ